MLDDLKAQFRHAFIAILPVLAAAAIKWVTDNHDTILGTVPPAYAGLAGVAITLLLLVLTPLTRQYGVGAPNDTPPAVAAADEAAAAAANANPPL